jgi:hypothetical protein
VRASSTVTAVAVALCVACTLGALACTEPNPRYRPGRDAAGSDGAGSSDGAIGDAAAFDLARGLIGYWKLDEPAGSTMAADSSGLGNHGLLERLDPQTAWGSGRRGGALQITAADDREAGVRIAASASVDGLQRFTVAAWAYRTDTTRDFSSVLSRQLDAGYNEIFNLSFTTAQLSIYVPPGNPTSSYPYITRSKRATPASQWIHVAATYDGSRLRLYLDGVEESSVGYAHPLPATTTPLYLGTNKNPSDGEPMVGRLDDVLLYSEALPAAAIAALAAGQLPPGR